jgi:hypothetical protein
VQRGWDRRVAAEDEVVARHPFQRVHRARVRRRVTDEGGVDAVRHRVAERERVRRNEQTAHDDRHDRDHGGALCRRPLTLPQAPQA